ncbi:MAG: flagellar hook assembly protein FlgD, partial [Devosiaceae bacterium]|nr:flagellar hook assembly protein FlgD [Devosiaceae bacterium]
TNRSAPESTVSIRDTNGNVVFTEEVSLASGDGQFIWNGTDNAGNQLADGNYSITIAGRDANGNHVPVATQITGTVTGVDLSGREPVLIVDGAEVKLSSVQSVQSAA